MLFREHVGGKLSFFSLNYETVYLKAVALLLSANSRDPGFCYRRKLPDFKFLDESLEL